MSTRRHLLSKIVRQLFRTSRAARRQTRRAFFEQLERREMLTSIPVALDDPLYATPLNTDLVISSASLGVVNNDFDLEDASLSASVVDDPAHGTLTLSSNGTFTYDPDTDYVGIDSFTYKVSDGTYDSNIGTASIAVGGNFGPRTNLDERIQGNMLHTGGMTLGQPLTMGLNLVYRSDSDPRPVVIVETSLVSGSSVPDSIDAVLTFGTVNGSTVSYNTTGLSAGDKLRFVLQVDASSLSTGMYDWTVQLTANFNGSGSISRSYTGQQAIVNRNSSEFGRNWWLDGLDQLVVSADGGLLVRGNGDTLWFASDGSGGFLKAEGDLSYATLVENVDDTFTLTTKYGDKQNFDSSGKLTSIVDTNDVTTSFTYSSGKLSEISDHFGRDITFAYTSGVLTGVTDFASRTVDLTHTSGKLTSVAQEDPDGAGSLAAPVWDHVYDGTTNLLVTQTDPLDHDTDYEYDSTSRRLKKITHHDLTTWQLVPSQTQGLKTGSGNSIYRPSDVDAKITDERGKIWKFKTDRLGNVTEWKDPLNAVTKAEFDQNGQIFRLTEADPDDGDSLASPITEFGYSSSGDLVKQLNPDVTTLQWTYNSLHRVLTATDEMNRVTTMTYDTDGNLLTVEDNGDNTWTYTVNSRGQVLTETSPDPDGAGPLAASVTEYAYDANGRLSTITWPDDETTVYAYSSADMVTSVTNELGFVTSFSWDALDRMTGQTLPDPDGAGSLTSPVWTHKYNALGLLIEEIDPLNNDTDYEYNTRNWLTKIIYPDPDGAGSLGRPERTFEYLATGQPSEVTPPEFTLESLTYTYDAVGQLTSKGRIGYTESFTYDKLGRLTQHLKSVSGELVFTETYAYDSRSRRTKVMEEDPDQGGPLTAPETVYAYNNASQLSSVTDQLGHVTSYSYTAAGWLNSVTLPDPDGSGPNFSPIYTYGYDALGRNTSVTDALNRITVTAYDNRHRVISVTGADPDGAGSLAAPVTEWDYDDAGRLTSVTDPLDRVTSYAYDNIGRMTSVTLPDPDGAGSLTSPVHAYAYNALGNVTTYTDPAGKATTIAYDNLQRQTSITLPDPDGGGSQSAPVWSYTFGANTLLASVTDPLSHVTNFGYDSVGRQTSQTTDLGFVTSFGYDLDDNLTSVTTPDPDGAGSITASVTSYQYDDYKRLTRITDPLGGQTNFTYDKAGQLVTLQDPEGNLTTWAYDDAGRVTMETNELDDTRSFYHDAGGNLTRKVDRNERVTQYVYDDLNRLTAEKWMDDGTPVPSVSISTTTQGGQINEVQRVGVTSFMGLTGGTFTLSFGGNTTSAIAYNASAATVQSALEGLASVGSGNVSVTKTQNTSNTQEWQLTFQGSLAGTNVNQVTIDVTNVTTVMGGATAIQATDTQGSNTSEVQSVTLSNATGGTFRVAFMGQTTAPIDYDATAGEVETAVEALSSIDQVSVTGNAGGPWTITFAGTHAGVNVQQLQGDAATAESGDVIRTLSFEYDAASQLTEASDPAATYSYTLDNLGRMTSETQDIAGLTPDIILVSTWDVSSNRTSLAAEIGGTDDFKNDYVYDFLNRMTRVTQQDVTGGNVVADKRVDFAYNGLGQFTTIDRYQNTSGSNIVAQTTYAYDDDNRLTDLDHKQSSTTLVGYDYGYDNMGRTTSIDSFIEDVSAFTYDKTSQLTGADHTSPRADESYSYDDNGNRTMSGYTVTANNLTTSDGTYDYEYDDEGNRTKRTKISDGSYEVYEWDHRNRLVKVTFKDSSHNVLKTVDQTYDIFNRWLRRTTDPDGPGSATAIDTFFAGYDGIHATLQFDGAAASSLDHRYLFGPAVDQILADEDVSSLSQAGNVLWALSDHLGTPRDLADQNESTYTTTVTNHRTFDSFGQLTAQTNSSVLLVFGFTGKIFDGDAGLQNNWNRWYDPTLGRWMSHDPLGFDGGDANLSRYVANMSLVATDPHGQFVWFVIIPIAVLAVLAAPTLVNAPAHGDPVYPPLPPEQMDENATRLSLVLPAAAAPTLVSAAIGIGREALEELTGVPADVGDLMKIGGKNVHEAKDHMEQLAKSAKCFVAGTEVLVDSTDLSVPRLTNSSGEFSTGWNGWLAVAFVGLGLTGYAIEVRRTRKQRRNRNQLAKRDGDRDNDRFDEALLRLTEDEIIGTDFRAVGNRCSNSALHIPSNARDTSASVSLDERCSAGAVLPREKTRQSPMLVRTSHLWLSLCLILAVTASLFPSTWWEGSPNPENPAVSYATRGQSSAISTQSIETIQVGQRVALAANPAEPFDDSLGVEVDPKTWRKIELRPDDHSLVVLLRPRWWIDERISHSANRLKLSVPEVGIHGVAEVLSISPCPPIPSGSGSVVIGTFSHVASETVELHLDGLEQPIRCTPNHAFWSHDRQAFVEAQQLECDERIFGDRNLPRVIGSFRRLGPSRVYNLEILGQHVYQVSQLALVVHNAGPAGSGPPVPDPNWTPNYDPGELVTDHKIAKVFDGTDDDWNKRLLEMELHFLTKTAIR